MKQWLVFLGYKNLRGEWDKKEIVFDISVIAIAVALGYIMAEVIL